MSHPDRLGDLNEPRPEQPLGKNFSVNVIGEQVDNIVNFDLHALFVTSFRLSKPRHQILGELAIEPLRFLKSAVHPRLVDHGIGRHAKNQCPKLVLTLRFQFPGPNVLIQPATDRGKNILRIEEPPHRGIEFSPNAASDAIFITDDELSGGFTITIPHTPE